MRWIKYIRSAFLYFNVAGGIFMLLAVFLSPELDWGSRIAAFTALCFFLSGLGIYFRKPVLHKTASAVIALIFAMPAFSLLASSLVWNYPVSPVSSSTALVFLLISIVEGLSMFLPFNDN